MQVSVTATGPADRIMTGELPAERIDHAVELRLQTMATHTPMDGFRPGKAPLAMIKKRFGIAARQEVIEELLEETFQQAVQEQQLRVAGDPQFTHNTSAAGQNLPFVAVFQVYPEISLADLHAVRIRRPVAQVQEADLAKMIEVIRKQHVQWQVVGRPAQTGDRVAIDFDGRLNGATFAGSKASDARIELGAGQLPEDFEAALHGMRAGETKTAAVAFPVSHPVEAVSGQTAQYRLKVKRVCAPVLPPVDAEFLKKFQIGDGSLETFRAEVKNNMTRELQNAINARLKQQVMDGLVAWHTLEVPQSLVTEEMRCQREESTPEVNRSVSDELLEQQARHQVKLRLICDEIVRRHGLQPAPSRVDARLHELASTYADPTGVIDYYRGHPESMQTVEAAVLEEMVVEWVLTQATVTDEVCDFDTVMNANPQSPA